MLAIFHSHWITQRRSLRDHIFIESTYAKLPDPGRVEAQVRKEKSEQSQTKITIYPKPTSDEIIVHLEEKGISNRYNQNGILVQNFPNPSSGVININLQNDSDIEIINQTGTVLRTYKLNSGSHSIQLDLPSGIYFVRDGNSYIEKLLITK